MTALGLVLTILSEHPIPVAVVLWFAALASWHRWVAPLPFCSTDPQPTDAEIALDVAQRDLRDRRIYDAVRNGRA